MSLHSVIKSLLTFSRAFIGPMTCLSTLEAFVGAGGPAPSLLSLFPLLAFVLGSGHRTGAADEFLLLQVHADIIV